MTNFSGTDFSNFAASRHSTRDFVSAPVPPEIIEAIIADGLTAPSWSNTRPFMVAVASGETRDRLSVEFLNRWDAVKKLRGEGLGAKLKAAFNRYGLPTSNWLISKPYHSDLAPRAQRIGKELYGLMGIERSDKAARDAAWSRNYEFFGAPVELFVFTHKSLGKFAASDAGLFIENLMLGAHARGLGTCAQGAVAIWEDAVRAEFDVPAEYSLLCGIALGYPSDDKVNSFRANRLNPSDITVPVRTKA